MLSRNKELVDNLLKMKKKFENAGMKVVVKMKKVIHNEKIKNEEVYKKAIEIGLNHLEATILANRINTTVDIEKYVYPRYRDIMDYKYLKDIDIATDAIVNSINKNEHIMFVVDYDFDGVSSGNIASLFFRDIIKYKNYSCLINKREYGNGINDVLKEQILKAKPDMIITFDHGSSSGKQLNEIYDSGIKVIVTDHHELSLETPPSKYIAFINPQRPECKYDKAISGCSVGYLLMLSLADKFNIGFFTKDMQNILSITAVSVISDSMKLNSITNRALVKTGLKIINSFDTNNWKRLLVDEPGLITYKALGWRISPLINSCSRMGNPSIAYRIFMEKEDRDIREAINDAVKLNDDRKKLQEELFREASDECLLDRNNQYTTVSKITRGLGIQGIIASKFVDLYKNPSIVFYYDKETKTYQGSGRGNGKVNLLEILREIEQNNKDKFIKLGGHKEAAGLTIVEDFYSEFKKQFDYLVMTENWEDNAARDNTDKIKHIHEVDLELKYLDYNTYQSIQLLAPYGQAWPTPLFSTIFTVKRVAKVSRPRNKDMYILELLDGKNVPIESVYYPNEDLEFEIKEKALINVIYEIEYSGTRHKGISLNIKEIAEY